MIGRSTIRVGFLTALLVAPSGFVLPADDPQIDADKLHVVDCQLPGQVRKLGGSLSYLGPRRAVRTTAIECEIRGGEYVAYDRADYATSLRVWQPLAERGDAQAQVYVGEIYEKGLGVAPDYTQAVAWYEKAAKQGNVLAMNHAAYLYEQGLGVPKDPVRALNLYRNAAGITTDDLTFESNVRAVREEAKTQIDALTAQLNERDRNAEELEQQLDETREMLTKQRANVARTQRELSEALGKASQARKSASVGADPHEIEALNAQIKDREQKLTAASDQVTKLESALHAQSGTLQTQLANAEREDAALRQQLGMAQTQATSEKSQLAAAQAKAQFMSQTISDLRGEAKVMEGALRSAQDQSRRGDASQNATENARNAVLQSRVAEQQIQLERQKAVITNLNGHKAALDAEIGRLESAISKAKLQSQSDAKANQQQAASAAANASAEQSQFANLQNELMRKTLALNELTAKLDADNRQIEADKVQLRDSAAKLGGMDAQVRRMNSRLAEHEADNAAQKAQIASLQSTMIQDRKAVEDYKKQLRAATQPSPALVAESRAGPTIAASSKLPDVGSSMDLPLGQNYALIIANSEYKNFPKLGSVAKDAQDVEHVLIDRYGFKGHTRVFYNATRAQMMNAVYEMTKVVGKGDNLLIYFAGHGALDESTSRGYWLPVDAENGASKINWISSRDMTEMVATMSDVRHILIVADSCYSGAMIRDSNVRLVSKDTGVTGQQKMMRLMARMPSRTVLTSGGNEPVLDSGSDGNSIFAREFIETLSRNIHIMTGSALYGSIFDPVQKAAMRVGAMTGKVLSQSPRYSMLADAGHMNGEFFFVPVGPTGSKSASAVHSTLPPAATFATL